MHSLRMRMARWLGVTALVAAGCGREAPQPPPPAPEANPTHFAMTPVNTAVALPRAATDGTAPVTRGDFNNDQLEDVAVAEQDEQGQNVVNIYLARENLQKQLEYFKAAGIRQTGDYTVSALMSGGTPGQIELITIFKYADGHKEMVHYRSRGDAFEEIMRKTLAPTPTSTE